MATARREPIAKPEYKIVLELTEAEANGLLREIVLRKHSDVSDEIYRVLREENFLPNPLLDT